MKLQISLLLIGCGMVLCAKQCCPGGEILIPRGLCGNSTLKSDFVCEQGRLLLKDIILDGDKVSTQDSPNYVFSENPEQYCTARMYKNITAPEMGTIPVALMCFEKVASASNSDLDTSGILTLISVLFLLATTVVYGYLPQLRDLQGLCYMCMCISMAFGFLFLGTLQLTRWSRGSLCTTTGFLIYASMMATFFWMNVICVNVYRTVQDAAHLKSTEKKQYFWYSCYAWGGTVILLLIILITNFVEGTHLKPDFGRNSCWFYGRTETWLFFYGPIALLISANIILFGMSTYNLCFQQTKKYEANKFNVIKYKFLLSLKLFCVMGISWIFEIISFALDEKNIIWKITDTFNCLQGIIIFILLVVLRRRAMRGLESENCCLPITRPMAKWLSPHDDLDDQRILAEETVEVRLN